VSEKSISVGIGELYVGNEPTVVFIAHGLGSCIGVCMYDKKIGIGGMAHIMLPEDNGAEAKVPAKFADTGIPKLLEALLEKGAKKFRLEVKLAGGAKMFSLPGDNHKFDIGSRNFEAVKITLKSLGLHITASEVGGTCGRTVFLYPRTGKVLVKIIGQQPKEI